MLQQQKHSFSSKLFRALRAAIISLNSENKSKDTKAVSSSSLKAEKLIIEEFKFRGNYLIQTSKDLTATFNLYFLLIGIFVSFFGVTYQFIGSIQSYSKLLVVVILFVLGLANFLFFLRFLGLVAIYLRNKTHRDVIKLYYIKQFQSQIPDLLDALGPPMGLSAIASHGFILYSIFVLVDSLCFAGAALLSSELWFHIDNSSILSLPIGPYPYAIASFAVIIVSLAHFLFYRLTLHEYVKKTLERWKPYNRLLVDTEAKYKQATSAGRSDT